MAPTKIAALAWSPELVERFAPSAARNPWGALESPREILQGSYIFEIEHGQQRALMAVRPVHIDDGSMRAEIAGFVSTGPLFHAAVMDRAAVLIAHQLGADVLGLSTQLPTMVKACQRQGWTTTGAILTKWVKVH